MKRLFFTFFLLFSQISAAKLVELKSTAYVEPNAHLTLLHLVDEEKSDIGEIRQKLENVKLMKVQGVGERVEFSPHSLAEHIKRALSAEERTKHKFSIPRKVQVLVQHPDLTGEYVTGKLKAEWLALCEPCRIEISELRLPLGQFKEWRMIVPKNLPRGSFNIPLSTKNDKGQEARYWIQGRVDVLKDVPVAQRALSAGERLSEEDFKYQWQAITFANDGVPAGNQMIGSVLKRAVSANQVIWSGHIEREKAVKRGDQARVFFAGGHWELSVLAIAENDAEVGESVTLKNPSTNKKMIGMVTAKGQVEVL